jgi:hypothetical protein
MKRLLVFLILLVAAGCGRGGSDSNQAAAPTTSATTTTVVPTTTEPTTTEEPTTTKAKVDDAAREGCKELVNAKNDDGIRRGMVFFSLSLNNDFAGPANKFIDADNSGDSKAANSALTDLVIACHAAGFDK